METTKIDIKKIAQNTGQITGLPANPRQWKKADVERLAKSIEETPELLEARPIIVMPHDGKYIVLGGNLRLAALKHLGRKDVPVYVLPEDTPIDKQKEIVIKDNGSFGAWDFDMLANEWDDLPLADWGVPSWETDTQDEVANVTEDDFDEEQDEIHVRCQKGDLWQLGEHRLMCGDATSREDVERLMRGERADLVFTDPPYGMKYTRHIPKEEQKFDMLKNDDTILDFFPCVEQFSDGFVFVCTTFKVLDQWIPLFRKYLNLSNMIIWYKGGGRLGDLKTTFAVDYEVILVSSRKHEIYGKRIGSVWECGRDNGSDYDHPTQKPVALSSTAITSTTHEGDIVLDLFGGSGSTLIACEQLNRRCFMMELDPHYCDVIIARWEKLTGGEATKLN